ncbi:MAG: energy-coupling factor transporter transmembrane protein EcfT [Anaerolineae bacterium]|nr:energy-coupling factor transporter transmembrane protein EcfT [Anaerolineae bacterium]
MAKVNVTNFMSNVGRDSWVHRLDPRTKIAILVFFGTIPLFFTDFRFIIAYIVLTIPLWLTSNIDFRPMRGPFTAVGVFLTIIFLLNALRGPSELTNTDVYSQYTWYIRFGPLVVTSHTVVRGLFLAMRLAVTLTIGLLIISTTDPTYLAKGLRKLKMPTTVVFMALAGLRFIPIITEQLFNILDAQTIRGVSGSRIEKTKLLFFPLFITSLRRTRTMGLACEAKGFGARRWNDFYEEFKVTGVDKVVLVALAVLAIVSLVLRFGLGMGTAGVGWIK